MKCTQPYATGDIIASPHSQSTEHLGRISEDLRSVNADLSLRVSDLRRRLSCCCHDSSGEEGDHVVTVVAGREDDDRNCSRCSSGFGEGALSNGGGGGGSSSDEMMHDGMIDVCMAAADQVWVGKTLPSLRAIRATWPHKKDFPRLRELA